MGENLTKTADVSAEGSTVSGRWRARLLVGLLHAVVFVPVAYHFVYRAPPNRPNLFTIHTQGIPFAFTSPWNPGHMHFLWHATGRAIITLVGTDDPRFGAVAATGLAYAVFGICIFEMLRRSDTGGALLSIPIAAAGSLAVALLETPTALLGWERISRPDGVFLPLYMPFVPTTMASLGLDVLLVFLASRLLRGDLSQAGRRGLPLVVILAAAAKPNLVAPLLPALLFLVWNTSGRPLSPRRWWEDRSIRDVLTLTVLPGVVMTIWQIFIMTNQLPVQFRGGWRLNPFAELAYIQAWSPVFWLALLFPLVAVVVLGSRLWDDAAVRLIAIAFVVGLVPAVLLERVGSEYRGDLLQFAQAVCAMSAVFITRRVIILWKNGDIKYAEIGVIGMTLAVYLGAGIMTWSCNVGAACLVA